MRANKKSILNQTMKKEFIIPLFCFFSIIATLLYYILGYSYLKYLPLLITSAITLYFVVLNKTRVFSSDIYILIVVVFCLLFSIINSLRFTLGALFLGLQLLTMSYSAYFIVNKCNINLLKVAKTILLLYFIFFFYSLVTVGGSPNDINGYLKTSSRNIVSGLCLIFQIFYSSCFYFKHKKLPLFTPVITFLICILSYGRAGIICALILLFITALSLIMGNNRAKAYFRVVLLILALPFSILFIKYTPVVYDEIYSNSNFSKAGLDSPRIAMNIEYWDGMNFIDFFAGRSFEMSPTIMDYDMNPHNSYIQGHHFMGVAYLMLFLYMLINLIKTFFKHPSLVLPTLLLSVFFIRISIDVISFPGSLDLILFYLYFYITRNPNRQL